MWLDEEPTDGDVFMEANARMRKLECQMLVTMTPLSGITRVAEYLVNTEDEGLRNKVMVKRVSSMDNPFTDKSWTLGLTDEERRLRVDGTFENPTGLVYSCFHRDTCVMDSGLIHPHLGCKYYAGVDFGVSHPTAVVFVVEDQYGYMQVYKEWRKSNASLSEIAQVISREDALVHLQYVVRDSASAREGLELDRL